MGIFLKFLIVTAFVLCLSGQHNAESERLSEKFQKTPKTRNLDSIRESRTGSGEYPCPDEEVISPCVCFTDGVEILLECVNVTSDQLTTVFQQDFPEKNLGEIHIANSSTLTSLDFDLNGVTVEVFLTSGTPIETISPEFLLGSTETLEGVQMYDSQLTNDGFPFDTLASYEKLQILELVGNNIDSLPIITSSSLIALAIDEAHISEILPSQYKKPGM